MHLYLKYVCMLQTMWKQILQSIGEAAATGVTTTQEFSA